MPELICKILHIGKTTYYKYLNNNYPIIQFLLSFSKKELEELLETGKIQKLEELNEYENFKNENRIHYLNYFSSNNIDCWDSYSINFYFGLLSYIKLYGKNYNSFKSISLSYALQEERPKKDLTYNTREVIQKRVLPALDYLDNKDGMYQYIFNATHNSLGDLLNYKINKQTYISSKQLDDYQTQAKYHIQKFKELEIVETASDIEDFFNVNVLTR